MGNELVGLVEETLREISDLLHNGQLVSVPSPLVDFYMLALHSNDLEASGYDPLLYSYKELEQDLVRMNNNGRSFPFTMDWVNSGDDSEGYYEMQITNDV